MRRTQELVCFPPIWVVHRLTEFSPAERGLVSACIGDIFPRQGLCPCSGRGRWVMRQKSPRLPGSITRHIAFDVQSLTLVEHLWLLPTLARRQKFRCCMFVLSPMVFSSVQCSGLPWHCNAVC